MSQRDKKEPHVAAGAFQSGASGGGLTPEQMYGPKGPKAHLAHIYKEAEAHYKQKYPGADAVAGLKKAGK